MQEENVRNVEQKDILWYTFHKIAVKFERNRRISARPGEAYDALMELEPYYRYFNSLPEKEEICFNHTMSEMKGLPFLKDLIIPDSVRLDPSNRRTADLLVRTNVSDEDVKDLSYSKFITICDNIERYQKKTFSEVGVSLFENRKPVSLADVIGRACLVNGDKAYLNYGATPYVPLSLDVHLIGLFENNYWTDMSYHAIIDDYVAGITF